MASKATFCTILLFCLYVLKEGRKKKKEFQDAEEKCFWKKESKKYYRGLSLFTPIQFLCMGKVGHVINLLITMLPSVLQRQLDDARNVFLELTILKT